MKTTYLRFTTVCAAVIFAGCTHLRLLNTASSTDASTLHKQIVDKRFLQSGTIILSRQVPASTTLPTQLANTSVKAPPQMAPLLGYFPPAEGYLPAENENWVEINIEKASLSIYKGNSLQKSIVADTKPNIAPGNYFLQAKQKHPLWYAPDKYFRDRQLTIPATEDKLRYRRGAFGSLALFIQDDFAIHSGPIWTKDVGGFRVPEAELSSLFAELPLGTAVVVK